MTYEEMLTQNEISEKNQKEIYHGKIALVNGHPLIYKGDMLPCLYHEDTDDYFVLYGTSGFSKVARVLITIEIIEIK